MNLGLCELHGVTCRCGHGFVHHRNEPEVDDWTNAHLDRTSVMSFLQYVVTAGTGIQPQGGAASTHCAVHVLVALGCSCVAWCNSTLRSHSNCADAAACRRTAAPLHWPCIANRSGAWLTVPIAAH
jgi:hypothetical protein